MWASCTHVVLRAVQHPGALPSPEELAAYDMLLFSRERALAGLPGHGWLILL